MSQQNPNGGSHRTLWVDLRAPFAVCAAEAVLLLALLTLLAFFEVARLPAIALSLLVLYLLTAGVTLLAFSVRYAKQRQAEATAEQVATDIYRLFRTSVDLPYAVVNGDGTVRIINTALQDILGYKSPLCSIPLRDVAPDVTMEEIIAAAHLREPEVTADTPLVPSPIEEQDPADIHSMVVHLPNGRRYHVDSYLFRRPRDHYYFLLFRDVNEDRKSVV